MAACSASSDGDGLLGWDHAALTSCSQTEKLVASDAQQLYAFGESVAVDGDWALIGSQGPNDIGWVYVFQRSGSTWTETQKLTASDGSNGDLFGYSVDLQGDTALVGALADDHAGGTDAGSVYVFTRSGSSWSEQQKLVAADGAAGDDFGFAVGVDGDWAVVGARDASHGGLTRAGAAYVFQRQGGDFVETQKLTAADAAGWDNYGQAVAIAIDTIVIGAPGDNVGPLANAGSAYAYQRAGAAWASEAKLVASDGAAEDQLGRAVALDELTAIVGAPFHSQHDGAAYVFSRSGNSWTEEQKLMGSTVGLPQFGGSVALQGDVALIGTEVEDVYVFDGTAGMWAEQQVLSESSQFFGRDLALDSGTMMVSAIGDTHANALSGAVFVYGCTTSGAGGAGGAGGFGGVGGVGGTGAGGVGGAGAFGGIGGIGGTSAGGIGGVGGAGAFGGVGGAGAFGGVGGVGGAGAFGGIGGVGGAGAFGGVGGVGGAGAFGGVGGVGGAGAFGGSGAGGDAGAGGVAGAGGEAGAGGDAGTGGTAGSGTGAAGGTAGTGGTGTGTATGGDGPPPGGDPDEEAGCGCRLVANRSTPSSWAALALLSLGAVFMGRRGQRPAHGTYADRASLRGDRNPDGPRRPTCTTY